MITADEFFSASPEWATYEPALTSDQGLVLDFLCGGNSLRGIEDWLATVDTRALDDGINRLFPFLAEKLGELAPAHPLLPFLRGNSRKTFYVNNLLLRRAAAKIADLLAAEIPVLILKGGALIQSRAYRSGLRPMADIDFLIPTDALGRALEILTPLTFDSLAVESLQDFQHGHALLDDLGFEYDLHWHILPQCCGRAERNSPFWKAAEPTLLHGVDTLCLSPTDSLFLICAHGIQWNPVPPIRWIPDSLALLRGSPGRIEWPRLVRLAAETETTLFLTMALRYLKRRFEAPIPADVVSALGNNTVSDLEASSLPLALMPWETIVPWQQAEPVVRAQVRLHAARHPGRPILVILPWERWTPEQSQVCESIGAVPVIRARGLPPALESPVRRHLQRHAASIIPAVRSLCARNSRASACFTIRLDDPDHEAWRVVVRTQPPPSGDLQDWSPHLEVAEVYRTPLDEIPRDAIQLEAGRFSVTRPATTAVTEAKNLLAAHNKRARARSGRD